MAQHVEQLRAFAKEADFFVGIDSDGCAFDTMELKHGECFIPAMIRHWQLQAVAEPAREVGEFVYLRSRSRGVNRFPGLLRILDLLAGHPQAVRRGYRPPPVDSLREWVANETRLSSDTLRPVVAETGDEVLARALAWSDECNAVVAERARDVPPLPLVGECLGHLAGKADIMVVSAAPTQALRDQWRRHGIAKHVGMFAGQELGSKQEHITHAAGGRYEPHRMLMIGDAPGDLEAVRASGGAFYPICPGDETGSWQRFHDEAMQRFFAGRYGGDYEAQRIDEFLRRLPSDPPWQR